MTAELEQRLREALHDDAEHARLVNPHGPPIPEAQLLSRGQQTTRPGRKILAVAAAIALVVATSVALIQQREQEPDVSASHDPKDQATVSGAVLTSEDLPVGWEAAPPEVEEQWQAEEDDLDQAFADCLDVDVSELQTEGPTARSGFVNSSEPNDEQIVSEVTMFPSGREAGAAVDRFRDEGVQRCYLEAAEQRIAREARDSITTISGRTLSGDDIEVGESTITALFLEFYEGGSYKDIGKNSIAFRLKVPLSSEGVEVDVFAVVGFVAKGRALVQTSFQTYFTPFDGGATSTSLAPRAAVLLTKLVLGRISTGAVDDPSRTGDPRDAPNEGPTALPDAAPQSGPGHR